MTSNQGNNNDTFCNSLFLVKVVNQIKTHAFKRNILFFSWAILVVYEEIDQSVVKWLSLYDNQVKPLL